jgi:D-threo-aldose 1-dehydrogenase
MIDERMTAFPRRNVGQTGLHVTELGFGGAPLGNLYRRVSGADAAATVDAAIAAGIRYFDTAPYYGFGLSERRLGERLRARAADVVLSTKVGRLLRPMPGHAGDDLRHGFHSPMPFEPVYDYGYDAVMRSFEDSLQRLGLARIDILLVHDIGTLTHGPANAGHFRALETGGYRALAELRDSGQIRAIGLGVNEWQVCEAAMEHGDYDCFLLAGRYTLLEQTALDSFLPKCVAAGATLIAGGAYNSGILARGTRHGGAHYYNYEPAPAEIVARVRRIEAVCEAHTVTLAAAALQFPLAHPLVSCVIPGLGNPRRVKQTLSLYNEHIPPGFWSDLQDAGLVRADAPVPEAAG